MRQGEIHVVAAQHQVVADADAGQLGHLPRAEPGSGSGRWCRRPRRPPAAAARRASSAPARPCAGGSSRSRPPGAPPAGGIAQTGGAGRLHRQGARGLVEGGRDRQDQLLLLEGIARKAVIPGVPHDRSGSWRSRPAARPWDVLDTAPGQEWPRCGRRSRGTASSWRWHQAPGTRLPSSRASSPSTSGCTPAGSETAQGRVRSARELSPPDGNAGRAAAAGRDLAGGDQLLDLEQLDIVLDRPGVSA